MNWLSGDPGERGKQGDHGQDGRQGEPGVRGRDGVKGEDGNLPLDYYEDPAVNRAIAQALGEVRVKWTDRRLLWIWILLVTCMVGMFLVLDDQADDDRRRAEIFQAEITQNCTDTRLGNVKVNGILDRLAMQAQTSDQRTPEEKARAVEAYNDLKLPVFDCPPLVVVVED